MKVTQFTRDCAAGRREQRDLTKCGWLKTSDFDWRITRGGMQNKRISEVRISTDGKQVWYHLEDDPAYPSYQVWGAHND